MAGPVKHPTVDFGSGHDLGIMRSSPTSGSALSVEPASDFLSLPLPLKKNYLTVSVW